MDPQKIDTGRPDKSVAIVGRAADAQRDLPGTTERREEESLAARQTPPSPETDFEWFRLAFDDSPSAMHIIGLGARVLEVNRACCELLGYSRQELLGKTLMEIAYPNDLERTRSLSQQQLDGTLAGFTVEVRYVRKDGTSLWTRVMTTAVRDGQGRFLYNWALVEDISHRRRIDILLNAQRDLAAALGGMNKLQAAWAPCLDAIMEVSGMDAGAIYQFGPKGVDLVCHRGISLAMAERSKHFPADSVQTRIAASCATLYLREDEMLGARMPEAVAEGHRAMALVTVVYQGGPIALIVLASVHWAEVPQDVRESLEAMAVLIGNGIARIRAQETLQQSEGQLRRLFANLPGLVFTLDDSGTIIFASRDLPPYRTADLLGGKAEDYLDQNYCEVFRQAYEEAVATKTNRTAEVCEKTGRWWSLQLIPTESAGGEPQTTVIASELTEYKRVLEALRESEERFRLAFEKGPIGMLLARPDTSLLRVNRAYTRMLGYTEEDMAKISWPDLVHPDDLANIWNRKASIERGEGDIFTLEIRSRHKDGRYLWLRLTAAGVRDQRGEIAYALGMVEDITERKRAEAALNRKQEFLRQLLQWQERDRKLIVYEIHDGLAQQLAGARFQLAAYRQVADKKSEEALTALRQASTLLDRAAGEARSLISGLRPSLLDECGVIAALEEMVTEVAQEGGPRIALKCDQPLPRLATPLEDNLFRIVQEAVNNACKHSGTKTVRVHFRISGDRLRVRIRDWGIGFDPAGVAKGHYGLRGIRERAQLFGGRASLESSPGKGTRILVELPLILPEAGGSP